MMKAPLIPGTRPVGAVHSSRLNHTKPGPEFAATRHPGGGGPRPQDRRGGVRTQEGRRSRRRKDREFLSLTYLHFTVRVRCGGAGVCVSRETRVRGIV